MIKKHLEVYGNSRQYYGDERAFTNAGTIADFSAADNSASFKLKQKMTGKTAANCRKDVEIIVPLKYLSNFWEFLECL